MRLFLTRTPGWRFRYGAFALSSAIFGGLVLMNAKGTVVRAGLSSDDSGGVITYRLPSDTPSLLPEDQNADTTSGVLPSWIINGKTCKTCAWPATAEMGTGNCT